MINCPAVSSDGFPVGDNGFTFSGTDSSREVFGVLSEYLVSISGAEREGGKHKLAGSRFFMGWIFFEE